MFELFKNNLLWRDGKYIAITLTIFVLLSFIFFKPLLILIFATFAFSIYFFRNPDRICPEAQSDASILICPSDGQVIDLATGNFEGYAQKVSIFLSPIDVHVNWSPCAGVVKQINYRPGKFLVAYAPKSSDLNERNDIIIECKNGKIILVRQIAGFVARRICCWVHKNDDIKAGQKVGMIRFGSRVDILMPTDVQIDVKVGDVVKGGQTILGRWI